MVWYDRKLALRYSKSCAKAFSKISLDTTFVQKSKVQKYHMHVTTGIGIKQQA